MLFEYRPVLITFIFRQSGAHTGASKTSLIKIDLLLTSPIHSTNNLEHMLERRLSVKKQTCVLETLTLYKTCMSINWVF